MAPDPAGSVTPWSDVLTFRSPDGPLGGHLRAVLYSQASHPVMIHKASTLISADYPFYANERLRQVLGAGVVPMFAQACGADNNAPWATGFDVCQEAGARLGDAVAQAAAHATRIDTSRPIHSETLVFDVPLRPLPDEAELQAQIAEQEALLARSEGEPIISAVDQPAVRREQLRLLREGKAPPPMPMEVQVLAFGRQLAVVALSHEVFSGYQLAIDRLSPFEHTAVWAYCNMTENYLPTDAEHARGGYEVNGGPRYYPLRSGPQVGTERLILSCVEKMLQRAYVGA